jgi:hypothetical protein
MHNMHQPGIKDARNTTKIDKTVMKVLQKPWRKTDASSTTDPVKKNRKLLPHELQQEHVQEGSQAG